MKRERSPKEVLKIEAVTKARQSIRSLQKQIAARLMEMTQSVEKLLEHLSAREVVHFLHAACEMDVSEAGTYVKASRNLKGSRALLTDSRAGFALVKALATADAETRGEALSRIREGATLGARDVSAIRAYYRSQKLTWAEIKTKEALAEARRVARLQMVQGVKEIDTRVSDIMHGVDRLRLSQVDETDRQGAIEELRKDSAAVLPLFEQVYGKRQIDVETLLQSGSRSTELVHPALMRIAEGRFGGEHGFHLGDRGENPIGLVRCLQRVTTALPPMPAHADMVAWPASAPKVIELCAGAGGMSLGLERAGYEPVALYEYDKDAAATLRLNRKKWRVIEDDIRSVDFKPYRDQKIDLLVGGLPCQPYSIEGYGRGKDDERDLLPQGVRAVEEMLPKAFVFENVTGLLNSKHSDHLGWFLSRLRKAGYSVQIIRMEAEDYGVPQERSRVLIVGLRGDRMGAFRAPPRFPQWRRNLGDALGDLMAEYGWTGAAAWAEARRTTVVVKNGVEYVGQLASTVVGRKGGSRDKERERWALKGIDIRNVADHAPTQAEADAAGDAFLPSLTLRMRARLQSIPDYWKFVGGKESAARQIGNAVPPPIGTAIGLAIKAALDDVQIDYAAMLHPDACRTTDLLERQGERHLREVPPLQPQLVVTETVCA